MTAEHYRTVLLKYWRFVICCSVLLGCAVALGSFLVASPYQSTATLQLVFLSSTASAQATANQTLHTELNLVTSDSILSQVAARYPGLTVGQLKGEIAAQIPSPASLLQITVSDPDAARAAHLANDLAAALISQQEQDTAQINAKSQQPLLDSLAATQRQIDADQATLDGLQANPSTNRQQIEQLQNDLGDLHQQYNQELQTLTALQGTQARDASFMQVVGVAQPSGKPVHATSWHLAVGAAGLGLGLLVGISLVLLRDRLDLPLSATAALSEALGWPVLEEVDLTGSNKVAAPSSAGQAATQPYRQLNQNLAFLGVDTPRSSLVVTSTLADSKAANVVAGGLASYLAGSGKRVILVDANFYRPSQHRRFGTPAEPGLGAAALAFGAAPQAGNTLEPFLYPARGESSPLRVLPAGPIPPNPKQVLKSRGMQAAFRALGKAGADEVVLAGPPVMGSADTCALAALADGVVVVIGRSHARKAQLLRMKQSLEEAGARVLGCVVWSTASNQSPYAERPDAVAGAPVPEAEDAACMQTAVEWEPSPPGA
jgi:Mrp family chromosome partitioning ATPase/capsular polysaccharide biosynthesis protein